MTKPSAPSSFENSITMKNSEPVGQSNVSTGEGFTGDGQDILPMVSGKGIEMSLGSTESTFPKADISDSIFSFAKSAALAQSITKNIEDTFEHHGTSSMKGEPGFNLSNLAAGERANSGAGNFTKEAHAEINGVFGKKEGGRE